jgi:voltage-gated potassium channel
MWWSVVTITTVGYGDEYPLTRGGRMTAVFVMSAGVRIIGALASILASILVPSQDDQHEITTEPNGVQRELEALRVELAGLRQLIATDRSDPPPG